MSEKGELLMALEQIEKDKKIKKEDILVVIENALVSAYKKHVGKNVNVEAKVNLDTDEMTACVVKVAVKDVANPLLEISLKDARKINKEIEVEVKGIEVNAKSKSVTQSMGGAIGYVSRGLGEEVGREMRERVGKGKINTFMAMKGEGLESKIGTRMIERGVKAAGGVGKEVTVCGKEVGIGGYVEYGEGVYEGKEELGDKGEVNSKGIERYVGIGLIGRKEEERWHVEVLARVGKQENDSESGDMGIGEKEGEKERYESGGMYVGGEMGGGYKVGEIKGIGIEMVGRVGMTGVGGREVKMETGERVKIEGIRVGKIKAGSIGRYREEEGKRVKPYVGVWYEYEKVGEARGEVEGEELPRSGMEGGSVIGEMGARGEVRGLKIKVGIKGQVGEIKGVEGEMRIGYAI